MLGICVGMQILFDSGEEHGVVTKGLGLLPGAVTRLDAHRVPHMGWNTVAAPDDSALFAGLPADARFYFVHSYAATDAAALAEAGARATTCTHDVPFVAAAERGPLCGHAVPPGEVGRRGRRAAAQLGGPPWLRSGPGAGRPREAEAAKAREQAARREARRRQRRALLRRLRRTDPAHRPGVPRGAARASAPAS